MQHSFTVTDVADEETRKAILVPLVEYNEGKAGPGHHRPLIVTLRDDSGSVVGGLWGVTGYGWLFTQYLAVPSSMRGRGIGTELLQMAEREAISRGCHSAWLDTFEFQARPFYEGLGYACFGTLPDYPLGHSRFFMRKKLQASAP